MVLTYLDYGGRRYLIPVYNEYKNKPLNNNEKDDIIKFYTISLQNSLNLLSDKSVTEQNKNLYLETIEKILIRLANKRM